jgi:hypothetical protein
MPFGNMSGPADPALPPRIRLFFATLSLVLFFVAAVPLYEEFSRRSDIWYNNWDRVRVERFPLLLVCAAACGVTACMFLLIVTGRLVYRGERDR